MLCLVNRGGVVSGEGSIIAVNSDAVILAPVEQDDTFGLMLLLVKIKTFAIFGQLHNRNAFSL